MIINQHKQCTLEGCNNLAIYEKNTVHIVILAVTKNAQTKLQAVKGRAFGVCWRHGAKANDGMQSSVAFYKHSL